MTFNTKFVASWPLALLACAIIAPTAYTHENDATAPHAMDHAPIGVMADHRHAKGEWMVSYRYMNMAMEGNRDGDISLAADDIVTTVPNRFVGEAGQPPTLRVIPDEMSMDMHMIGGMYGLNDDITLMVMTSYLEKEMSHTTYQGGMGTSILGTFNVKNRGWGDTTLGTIIGLDSVLEELLGGPKPRRALSLSMAISLPTGSVDSTAQILTPMGMTPSPRSPYAMQVGTGTYDLKPSLTYYDRNGKLGWGGQLSARAALAPNDEGYQYGDRVSGTVWLSYEPSYGVSVSARLAASSQDSIDGIDANIAAPVQTANPDNYGGEQAFAYLGVNLLGQEGKVKGHRLAAEFGIPISRDLNGPQMETDGQFTLAWQKAF